jgi:hypothetical protein
MTPTENPHKICEDFLMGIFNKKNLRKKILNDYLLNSPNCLLHWQLSDSIPVNDKAPQSHDVQDSFLKPCWNDVSWHSMHGELER